MTTIKYSFEKRYPFNYTVNVHNDGSKSFETYDAVSDDRMEKRVFGNYEEFKEYIKKSWQPSTMQDEIYYNNL